MPWEAEKGNRMPNESGHPADTAVTVGTADSADTDAVHIRIDYYALFRACAGRSGEELALASGDAARLYEDLRTRYRFPLERSRVHLAVNDAYAPWETPLASGDRVVFVAPVSGG